jgi:hypothetical protein
VDLASAPPSAAADDPPEAHPTSVVESGNFSIARCSCGWFAPARRSRERARRDADQHTG